VQTGFDYLASLEQFGIKLGLDQIRGLLSALGHPDTAFPSFIVAGTNGKGSVAAMAERGLRAAGYRTGRYTSPHLVAVEERFAVDGQPVDSRTCDDAIARIREAARRLPAPPSYFEATTAVALELFRAAHVDLAVLEVGMGGRLDATNAVTAAAVAITAIDFDHEAWLGHTLDAIAREKAGVIKSGTRLVVAGPNPVPVLDVVRTVATGVGAALVVAADDTAVAVEGLVEGRTQIRVRTPAHDYGPIILGLRGRHQVSNALTAIRLLEELPQAGPWRVSADAVRAAVETVVWPGRLEVLPWRGNQVLIDGAHNPAGARALASYVQDAIGRPVPLVIGIMRDKNVDGILQALAPVAARVFCTAARSPRAATPEDLVSRCRALMPGVQTDAAPDPRDALARALASNTVAVVAGSLYLAGEVRALVS